MDEGSWDHSTPLKFKCPTCFAIERNEALLIVHYIAFHHQQTQTHIIICPKCSQYMSNEMELINHYVGEHQEKAVNIKCAVCNNAGYEDGMALLKHMELMHSVILPVIDKTKAPVINEDDVQRLPKVGDRVIAMWGESKWQYFTAKIVK